MQVKALDEQKKPKEHDLRFWKKYTMTPYSSKQTALGNAELSKAHRRPIAIGYFR